MRRLKLEGKVVALLLIFFWIELPRSRLNDIVHENSKEWDIDLLFEK